MTRQEPAEVENRLRTAFADTAATVRPESLSPDAPARRDAGRNRHRRQLAVLVVPLGAVIAVVLIAVAAIAVPHALRAGTKQPSPPASGSHGAAAGTPKYLMTIPAGGGYIRVWNAVTGRQTEAFGNPAAIAWYGVAAEGPRTFLAARFVAPPCGHSQGDAVSYLYRLVLNNSGQVASMTRTGEPIPGWVRSVTVTPDGRYAGYLVLTLSDKQNCASAVKITKASLVVADLTSGKIVASWPVPGNTTVQGMAIDAAGNRLAISAYYYNPVGPDYSLPDTAKLVQWTSVLPIDSSGRSIGKLPAIELQSSALALSQNGDTLYEFLQAGTVTPQSWRSQKAVTFYLVAVSARTGKVTKVFHAWQSVWSTFVPQLSLAPGGRYLLIANQNYPLGRTSLARVDLATGQFTALPAKIASVNPWPKGANSLQPIIDPLAW